MIKKIKKFIYYITKDNKEFKPGGRYYSKPSKEQQVAFVLGIFVGAMLMLMFIIIFIILF